MFSLLLCNILCYSQQNDGIPKDVKKLIAAYPAHIKGYDKNHIVFGDNSMLIFDDGKKKSFEELLESPDVQDMFVFSYSNGEINPKPEKNYDPGRIRNDELLKKMYGKNKLEVQKKLVEIIWCPMLAGQKLKITSENGIDKRLLEVSAELDKHPEWKEYLKSAGTFNWRVIRGANRLSAHSFGIAIDLNTKYSNYWQWDCRCKSENADLTYRNQIPQGIIDVFEKHGFIWGGRWYHYDTMHFEYRPELL